jgi:RNA polymerase sigma-70 factor (ECF subfamily)
MKQQEWARHFENDQDFTPDTYTEDYMHLIEQAVANLPPQQQKVYILKRRQGLKYEEIANQLDISPETARKHLAAALRNITEYVKTHLHVILFILASSQMMN